MIAVYLLLTGSALLEMSVLGTSLPFGNLITWWGMIALPGAVFFGVKQMREPETSLYKVLSLSLKIILFLGVIWLPVSYFLAGNIFFNFTGNPGLQGGELGMKLYWANIYTIVIGSIGVLLIYLISLLFKK